MKLISIVVLAVSMLIIGMILGSWAVGKSCDNVGYFEAKGITYNCARQEVGVDDQTEAEMIEHLENH